MMIDDDADDDDDDEEEDAGLSKLMVTLDKRVS